MDDDERERLRRASEQFAHLQQFRKGEQELKRRRIERSCAEAPQLPVHPDETIRCVSFRPPLFSISCVYA